ncbi:hypothetical protein WJX72_009744 [[Myrmecia] bisecta]|uniref:Uncharacterized protein n=1 Tax=[Myrmecia] bisecta TaxID=41462 RepID=A0AAW1PQ48_9CHLO
MAHAGLCVPAPVKTTLNGLEGLATWNHQDRSILVGLAATATALWWFGWYTLFSARARAVKGVSLLRRCAFYYCVSVGAFGAIRGIWDTGRLLLVGAAFHNLMEWGFLAHVWLDQKTAPLFFRAAVFYSWCVITITAVLLPQLLQSVAFEQTLGIQCDYFLALSYGLAWATRRHISKDIGAMWRSAFFASLLHFFQIWPLVAGSVLGPCHPASRILEFLLTTGSVPCFYFYTDFALRWDEQKFGSTLTKSDSDQPLYEPLPNGNIKLPDFLPAFGKTPSQSAPGKRVNPYQTKNQWAALANCIAAGLVLGLLTIGGAGMLPRCKTPTTYPCPMPGALNAAPFPAAGNIYHLPASPGAAVLGLLGVLGTGAAVAVVLMQQLSEAGIHLPGFLAEFGHGVDGKPGTGPGTDTLDSNNSGPATSTDNTSTPANPGLDPTAAPAIGGDSTGGTTADPPTASGALSGGAGTDTSADRPSDPYFSKGPFKKLPIDVPLPEGYRLATVEEAKAAWDGQVKPLLLDSDIAKLDGGYGEGSTYRGQPFSGTKDGLSTKIVAYDPTTIPAAPKPAGKPSSTEASKDPAAASGGSSNPAATEGPSKGGAGTDAAAATTGAPAGAAGKDPATGTDTSAAPPAEPYFSKGPFKKLKSDAPLPEGYRLATVDEAKAAWGAQVKPLLLQWDIVQLDGGYVEGSGYRGQAFSGVRPNTPGFGDKIVAYDPTTMPPAAKPSDVRGQPANESATTPAEAGKPSSAVPSSPDAAVPPSWAVGWMLPHDYDEFGYAKGIYGLSAFLPDSAGKLVYNCAQSFNHAGNPAGTISVPPSKWDANSQNVFVLRREKDQAPPYGGTGGKLSIWVNGTKLAESTTYSPQVNLGSKPAYISIGQTAHVQSFAIYNTPLSDDEVKKFSAAFKENKPPAAGYLSSFAMKYS